MLCIMYTHTSTHIHAHLHTGAIAVTSGLFNDLSQSPIVSGVQCTGSEIDLLSCSHSNSIDRSSCGNHDDTGVVCQGKLQHRTCGKCQYSHNTVKTKNNFMFISAMVLRPQK